MCDTSCKPGVVSLEFTPAQWVSIYNALGYLESSLNLTQTGVLQSPTESIIETVEECEEIRRKLYISLGF